MNVKKLVLASLVVLISIANVDAKGKKEKKKRVKKVEPVEEVSTELFKSKPVNKLKCWRFGLARTGANDTKGVPNKKGEKWRTKIGGNILSSPVKYDDMLFVGSDKGMYALNAESGEVVWNIPIKNARMKNFGAKGGLDGVVGSPCIADGLVFFVGTDGKIHCVDAKTGEKKWSKEPKGTHGKFIKGSPGVAYGLVFTQGAGGWIGLDIETGKQVWKGVFPGPKNGGFSTNGKYYFTLAAGGDYIGVMNLNTGLKEYRVMVTLSYCRATPAIVGNRVYGASVALIGTNPRFPSIAWGDFTKEDGPKLLKFIEPDLPAKERAASFASPTVWNGKLFLGCDSGYLYTYDADKLNMIHKFKTGAPVRSSASISTQDETVYFTSYDGKMYALDTTTGAKRWEHKLSAPTKEYTEVNSCPWVEDGVVYIGTTEGDIVAIH